MKIKNTVSNYMILLFSALLISMTVSLDAGGVPRIAKGIVFDDTNHNRVLDKDEKGIPGIVVSNQYQVVKTDEKGFFSLPVTNETIIFVSKPAGYNVPLNENNFPQFYYIHQPAGSPPGLKYPGITPSGKLPAMIFFPLFKSTPEENFDIIVIGDPQTANSEEIGFFRDNIVAGLMGTDARFYLALGDILYNDLSLYNQMHQVVGQIGIPVHHVIGNHDMNFQVPDHIHEAETFKRFHGPDYYSFNYGKVHFVILNSIKYNGWNQKENKAGRYTGYLHDKQLTWLKNDLAFVPQDHLVVFAMHIPVFSELYPQDDYSQITNRPEFFRILENRQYLLALAGHMHFVDYLEFTPVHGWHGKAIFPSLTAGAGCGTWWHGPKNPHGIPFGLCTDGAPNGYFCFSFTGNKYRYKFCPAAPSAGMQMRINSPIGTLSFQDFKEGKISVNVNVFTGTPQTTVAFSLDNGLEINMERMVMKDPFFSKLIEMNKTCYLDWMEPTLSTHTWSATLPNGLTPGIHRLKVTAADSQGNMFSDYCLFEIPTESQKPNF